MQKNESKKEKPPIEEQYLCSSPSELITVYVHTFEELGNLIHSLFKSNEEMLKYDPNDYDLIQARQENLEIINKQMLEMKKIQEKIKVLSNNHPIVSIDIFDYFKDKNEKDNEKNDNVDNSNNDIENNNNNVENNIENNNNNENEIIKELEI